jgi:hypothetical protein
MSEAEAVIRMRVTSLEARVWGRETANWAEPETGEGAAQLASSARARTGSKCLERVFKRGLGGERMQQQVSSV